MVEKDDQSNQTRNIFCVDKFNQFLQTKEWLQLHTIKITMELTVRLTCADSHLYSAHTEGQ